MLPLWSLLFKELLSTRLHKKISFKLVISEIPPAMLKSLSDLFDTPNILKKQSHAIIVVRCVLYRVR
jgi:hypothetical protein